jgi:hypothetical protein
VTTLTDTAPTLQSLPADIYSLFDPTKNHEVNEENLEWAAQQFKDLLRVRLKEREPLQDPLRFSSMGRPDRQIWYMAQAETKPEPMQSKTYFKFLYGDVIELLILFLAREAGHSVERTQEELEVNGVKGHIDAVIDGVVVDVKSASPYGFKKFKTNSVLEDDPFGYVQQLAGYSAVLNPGKAAAWVAFDKVDGEICVAPLSASVIADFDPETRINHLKEVVASPTPPERCYPDVEDGKSGNRKLDTACSYCAFKHECWPGLRTFLYSGKPRHLTKVVREPDVLELKTNEVPQ